MRSHGINLALLGLFAASDAGAQTCPAYDSPTVSGNVATRALTKASGIAASRINPGVLWSHNDSGGSNNVFAIGYDGAHLGSFTLSGSFAIDWEDIAIGPGPTPGIDYLYVADIGDNFNFRPTVRVYRVAEPMVSPSAPAGNVTLRGVQTITVAYPDGPRDAETIMVDVNGDIYIVTKRVSAQGRVYRAAFPQATSGTITMEYVTSIPWGAINGAGGATAGDIAHDGSAIVVRRLSNYSPAATLWRRAPGMTIAQALALPGCELALPASPQGEAIAFAPDDLSLFSLSEGPNQPIHFIAQIHAPGDANGDDVVNVTDLLAVIEAWGACPSSPLNCHADFNDDGQVNVTDLLTVISNWG